MCIERTREHKDQQEVNGAAEHGHLHSSQIEKRGSGCENVINFTSVFG